MEKDLIKDKILNCRRHLKVTDILDVQENNGVCLPPKFNNRIEVYDAVIEEDPKTGERICRSPNCPSCQKIN